MFNRALKFFGYNVSKSKNDAKSRLQVILIQDRLAINVYALKALRSDLAKLLSKYFEIDDEEIEIELLQEKRQLAFVANVPISNLKRRAESLSLR